MCCCFGFHRVEGKSNLKDRGWSPRSQPTNHGLIYAVPWASKHLVRRYLDPQKQIPITPQEVFGRVGVYLHIELNYDYIDGHVSTCRCSNRIGFLPQTWTTKFGSISMKTTWSPTPQIQLSNRITYGDLTKSPETTKRICPLPAMQHPA